MLIGMRRFLAVLTMAAYLAVGEGTRVTQVQPRNTPLGITHGFGVSLQAAAANQPLSSTPGVDQTLLPLKKYTVRPGDTLYRIGRRYTVSVTALEELNGLHNSLIIAGQTLWIPPNKRGPTEARLTPKDPQPVASVPIQIARPVDRVELNRAALAYLGTPYRYGGTNHTGIDCSGLVDAVFSRLGYNLPRTTTNLWRSLPKAGQLRAGDLVFFSFRKPIDHVGIYLGNGRFIHADSIKGKVVIDNLYTTWYQNAYRGARTVVEPPSARP